MLCLTSVSLPVMAADESGGGNGEKVKPFWIETRMDTKRESQTVGWYEHGFTEMFGMYALVSLENTDRYREGYAGITMKPFRQLPWLQFGIGIGRERDGESSGVRRNAFFSIDSDKVNAFGTFEDGVTGPWHRVNAVYNVSEAISLGTMHESKNGWAPRAEYHITKDFTVWTAVFRDRAVFAVNYSF